MKKGISAGVMLAGVWVAWLFPACSRGADRNEGGAQALQELASPDMDVRRAAVDKIQTMDLPGIPAACLPLLQDEGLSTRRQAARAIGSRFAEIPQKERKRYVKALEVCAAQGPEDVKLISQRAIGLLTGDYRYPSFSVGPHGKWVLYERRKLPVIAPVRGGGPHMLLCPMIAKHSGEELVLRTLSVTSESASGLFDPHWHPDGNAVAMMPRYDGKRYHPTVVWSADNPELVVLEPGTLEQYIPAWHDLVTSRFVRWEGTKVIVEIYAADPDDAKDYPAVAVSYDIRTRKIERVATDAAPGKR